MQSTVRFVIKILIKGTRGIGLWLGHHFALHHYACSITIGVDSISLMSSQSCQDLLESVPSLQVNVAMLYYSIVIVAPALAFSSGSSSVNSFSSGECGNAILQYWYGFNRRQLWLSLLAQGLFRQFLLFR